MDNVTLLQRQAELDGSLRVRPANSVDLLKVKSIIDELVTLFNQIGVAVRRTRNPAGRVFQCLLHISSDWNNADFDTQHQRGNIPMHQAKVLDRREAGELEPELRRAMGDDVVTKMAELSDTLRSLVRMKVEDDNDLRMAKELIFLGDDYLHQIHALAHGNAQTFYRIYSAASEEEIVAVVGVRANGSPMQANPRSGCSSPPKQQQQQQQRPVRSAQGTNAEGVLFDGDLAEEEDGLLPLPTGGGSQAILDAFREEANSKLMSVTSPPSDRIRSLKQIRQWLTRLSTATVTAHLCDVVSTIGEALNKQASEKRSAIFRLVTDIISCVCLRSDYQLFYGSQQSAVISIFTKWTQTLLKSVFVTVSAIATAASAVLADVVVSSCGHDAILTTIADALKRGTQPELRRQCLSLLALGVVASQQQHHRHSLPATLVSVATTYMDTGDGTCRRCARTLANALRVVAKQNVSVSDPKTEKLLTQEEAEVRSCCHSVEQFEIIALQREVPSKTSLIWEERQRANASPATGKRKSASRSGSLGPAECNSNSERRRKEEENVGNVKSNSLKRENRIDTGSMRGSSTSTSVTGQTNTSVIATRSQSRSKSGASPARPDNQASWPSQHAKLGVSPLAQSSSGAAARASPQVRHGSTNRRKRSVSSGARQRDVSSNGFPRREIQTEHTLERIDNNTPVRHIGDDDDDDDDGACMDRSLRVNGINDDVDVPFFAPVRKGTGAMALRDSNYASISPPPRLQTHSYMPSTSNGHGSGINNNNNNNSRKVDGSLLAALQPPPRKYGNVTAFDTLAPSPPNTLTQTLPTATIRGNSTRSLTPMSRTCAAINRPPSNSTPEPLLKPLRNHVCVSESLKKRLGEKQFSES